VYTCTSKPHLHPHTHPTSPTFTTPNTQQPPTNSDCDGSKAAQAFCKKEGYARVLGYGTTDFRSLGVPAVFMMGTQNVAEVRVCLLRVFVYICVCGQVEDKKRSVRAIILTHVYTRILTHVYTIKQAGILDPNTKVLTEVQCDQV
jgi:hypothetical protein